jgi:AmmeMemoRadiSam system protein B
MEGSKIRRPSVAGQFYPASRQGLTRQIQDLLGEDVSAKKESNGCDCLACLLPHAGYVYSGRVAAQTVSQVKIKDKIILLGPNHTGYGAQFSIVKEGSWQTPLGEVPIDSKLAEDVLKGCKYLEEDNLAHAHEHSLEVELPLLQYFNKEIEIVPIAFFPAKAQILQEIGRDIAGVIKRLNLQSSTLLVASSDMTHYEPQDQAEKKDKEAIQAILELDENRLLSAIHDLEISMCGFVPVAVMLVAAKELGAKKARLVKYMTSGDVTQDKSSVVGYAGVIIY